MSGINQVLFEVCMTSDPIDQITRGSSRSRQGRGGTSPPPRREVVVSAGPFSHTTRSVAASFGSNKASTACVPILRHPART
jgi:hypothetical protein